MHSMVARAAEPRRSASSSCAEPKMRRKSLVRKLPSLVAAIAVIAFIYVLRMIVDRFETHARPFTSSRQIGLAPTRCSRPLSYGLCRSRSPPRAAFKPDSVSAQCQRLDWKQQGLDAQQHRVHEADGVDGMQRETLECAGLLRSDQLMVAGVSVDDAAASG